MNAVQEITGKADGAALQDRVIESSSTGASSLLDENKLAELERMSPKGRRFVVEVLDGFIRDGDALIDKLTHALDVGDYRQVLDSAHALKGCAVSVGAGTVYELTLKLNELNPAQIPIEGPSLVDRLAKDWAVTKTACMEFIAGESPST